MIRDEIMERLQQLPHIAAAFATPTNIYTLYDHRGRRQVIVGDEDAVAYIERCEAQREGRA